MSRGDLRCLIVGSALTVSACGGGAPSPMGPTGTPTPTPTPADAVSLDLSVFYDQDRDGVREPGENVVLPNVLVRIGDRSATTDATGNATISVAAGTQMIEIDADTLPPYYEPPSAMQVEVSGSLSSNARAATQFDVPTFLSIGSNQSNIYMAFGNSITDGDGSSDGRGYRPSLENRLRDHFGAGAVINDGVGGTRSQQGADRLQASLIRVRPAFTLIHYGVNDWNLRDCQFGLPGCFTLDSIRRMLTTTRDHQSRTFLATILPANTFFDERTPPQRNDWVRDTSRQIKQLAVEFGVVVVDLEGRFWEDGPPDKSGYYFDHVHPNDAGYQVIADEFFEAITTGVPGFAPPEVPRVLSFGFYRN